MKINNLKNTVLSFVCLTIISGLGYIDTLAQNSSARERQSHIRANMEFLASDAMEGRGSGTKFELLAGEYIASQLKQYGVQPAGDSGTAGGKRSYIQTVNITQNSFAGAPEMKSYSRGANVSFVHGKEMIILRLSTGKISGALQETTVGDKINKGSVAFVTGENASQKLGELIASGAAAIIVEETPRWRERWKRTAARKIAFSGFSSKTENPPTAIIVVSHEAAKLLSKVAEGTKIEISGKLNKPKTRQTWNAVGMINGRDAKLSSQVILLSAHMDHLGIRENAPGTDKIFNGADDDASGCVAVLELARILANKKRPKRTIYFAFFGSEESGGFGSKYFANNLDFPNEKLIANLQFEMLGRSDEKVAANELWLTGYDRSDLGAELAKHGALLVNDPHPDENFFQRSDNYTLAKKGIIAHTVSSFGLHKDYHQASDEIETIDYGHMTAAINSMVKPIRWLANSRFTPKWHEGKRP